MRDGFGLRTLMDRKPAYHCIRHPCGLEIETIYGGNQERLLEKQLWLSALSR
jgi:hypothetical protein